jgi:hypothetical protein
VIRHLRLLSRPVPGVADGAVALAVYAEPGPGGYRYRRAAESGDEGVACVDDAARAALLYCRVWQRHPRPWVADAARGHLAFVTGMQGADGRFANFIRDWSGTPNSTGPTSAPGATWWAARALRALAAGYAAFGDPGYAAAFRRGLAAVPVDGFGAAAAAQLTLAALAFWEATGDARAAAVARAGARIVNANRTGPVLVDDADADPVHLWGRYQELALAAAGRTWYRPDLVAAARDSAEAVLVPAASALATRAPTVPYEAGCVARALAGLGRLTGQPRYHDLAGRARAWFTGRNAAGVPVYDRSAGRVYDGVDPAGPGAAVSANAGAEANVEGALALLPHLPWYRYDPPGAPAGLGSRLPVRGEVET